MRSIGWYLIGGSLPLVKVVQSFWPYSWWNWVEEVVARTGSTGICLALSQSTHQYVFMFVLWLTVVAHALILAHFLKALLKTASWAALTCSHLNYSACRLRDKMKSSTKDTLRFLSLLSVVHGNHRSFINITTSCGPIMKKEPWTHYRLSNAFCCLCKVSTGLIEDLLCTVD